MNIKDIISVGTAVANRSVARTNKYSPEILIGVGIVGLVTAGVLAARASRELDDELDDLADNVEHTNYRRDTNNIDDSEHRKALVKAYAHGSWQLVKLYGPSITLGAASVACVLGGHRIMRNRNVALAAAYKLVETSYSEYRKRVVNEIGEERENKIYIGQSKELVVQESGKKKSVLIQNAHGHSPYARFFDPVNSPHEFKENRPDLNQFFLLSVQRYQNHRLQTRGYVFLNEVYEALGMEGTSAGQVVGWMANPEHGGDGFIDFGMDNPNNEMARMFLAGEEAAILLDFNVDGVIYNKI